MSAAPADRTVMDNQFKQMKTHARLLSKGMWYEWRMKLLDGLKEALSSTAAGMAEDNDLLLKHTAASQAVLPMLLEKNTQLEQDCARLQERAAEFDSSKQEELDEARTRIVEVDEEIAEKKRLIEQYKAEVRAADSAMVHAQQEKLEYLQVIRDAQRVREELRGWSTNEVNLLKGMSSHCRMYQHTTNDNPAKVDSLEDKHGWRITSASGSTLTMTYLNSLQLFFDVTAFADSSSTTRPNSPISLTYIGDDAALHRRPAPLSTHSRFFLQFMRAHLQCLVQSSISIPSLLSFVSTGWNKAYALATEVRTLDFTARTICAIRGDEEMAVECMITLPAVSTKVCVELHIAAAVKNMQMLVKVQPRARVVYGEAYKQDRMTEFVRARVEGKIGVDGKVQWADAVKELRGKLIAQGRKGDGRA
jgi:kinetochore protein Spc7/SPC105